VAAGGERGSGGVILSWYNYLLLYTQDIRMYGESIALGG